VKMFDADKTRMIGQPYGEKKLSRYVKPFSSDTGLPERHGQTDRQYCYINIARQYSVTVTCHNDALSDRLS